MPWQQGITRMRDAEAKDCANEEIFDVVDELDRVVGQAPRSVVHAQKLFHRAVHIFVFDSRGRLLIQKRSARKDEYPLCYTSSASGHVSSGETYDETAPRELAEELGLEAPLERLRKFSAGPQTAFEQTVLYKTVSDATIVADPLEIDSLSWHTLDELAAMIARSPREFSPCFVTLFTWYREHAGRGCAQ
jgi:16S rRNA (adenine1518-N6/adenine1519-N6)-dimethyltransferase